MEKKEFEILKKEKFNKNGKCAKCRENKKICSLYKNILNIGPFSSLCFECCVKLKLEPWYSHINKK